MTVLDQYARLETTAIWHAGGEAQRRDVYVSLGEATLVIHDGQDIALAHWSLPAVLRLNPGKRPARYAPGKETLEELEISDETMIEAIEKVRGALSKGRPREGRLRLWLILGLIVVLGALAVFWMPSALSHQTASIVPKASREAIGQTVLEELRPFTGAACRTRTGDLALARLKNRILPQSDLRLVVLPQGLEGAVDIPGGIILIGRDLVEDYESPDVLGGFILAESAELKLNDPLELLLENAGFPATFSLLTRGELSSESLAKYAREIVAQQEPPVRDVAVLAPLFSQARLALSPYAYAIDSSGETVLPLIEADGARQDDLTPVLNDSDWVALQNICGG